MTPDQLTGNTTSHLRPFWLGTKRFWLLPEAGRAIQSLAKEAQSQGYELCIASGFRSFSRQQTIWNKKLLGQLPVLDSNSQPVDIASCSPQSAILQVMRWSALPGASRHHWGTDIDVYCRRSLPKNTQLKLEPWEYDSGHQTEFSQWLIEKMAKYGFYQPYSQNQGGVAREPWHISYFPVANQLLLQLSENLLHNVLIHEDIVYKESILNILDQLFKQFVLNVNAE